MRAVVLERLAAQRSADDLDVLARAAERLAPGDAVPALDDLRARRAESEQDAAPESWSSVATVIAVAAGVRAGICMIAVPIPICSVVAAIQLATVTASAPHASDVQAEWKPSRSASCASATPPRGSS